MKVINLPNVEVNVFRKANTFKAKVVANKVLVHSDDDSVDVRHIELQADGYDYLEGQSAGVIAPGETDKGKPHAVRLYSIASIGTDLEQGHSLELCVKRVVYQNEEGQVIRGVCSNYICDLKVGAEIDLTGPCGRSFLLPETSEINRPYVFIATGTGIAPFKPMIDRLLKHSEGFNNTVYLFFGVRNRNELLYDELFNSYQMKNFRYITALSREEKNAQGSRMYVHHKMLQHKDELAPILENPDTLIYVCGLKGMEDGISEVLPSIISEAATESLKERIFYEVY